MSTTAAFTVFAVATAVVVVVAPPMAGVSDELASRTRIGAALFGAVFLGASTSLPGIVVTVSAALDGRLELAAANALGGIVAQTMFLSLADISYGKGALQREGVSHKSTAQFALVVGLLALVLVALAAPTATVGLHATTPLLVVAYLAGVLVIRRMPMRPEEEADDASAEVGTKPSASEKEGGDAEPSLLRLWAHYGILVVALGAAGLALSWSVDPIASALGLHLAAAGALLTATATSSPELFTAIAAARRGALRLSVGDIAGGNAFDVLFLAAADVAVFGTLYPALGRVHVLLAGTAVLLNAVLLIGFIRRGRGVAGRRVAPESIVVLVGYVCIAAAMVAG